MIDIKQAVSEGRTVKFTRYHDGNLWYQTEFGDVFPVPISDIGNATFGATERAILLMRYMRQWNQVGKTEMEQLMFRMYEDPDGLRVQNFGITLGDRQMEPEALAAMLNRVLDEIESGQAEVVTDLEDY